MVFENMTVKSSSGCKLETETIVEAESMVRKLKSTGPNQISRMIIWVGMGYTLNIHKIFVTKFKENLDVDRRIFLKWVTRRQDVRTWSQLVGLG